MCCDLISAVHRGFATTSVPTKKARDEAAAAAKAQEGGHEPDVKEDLVQHSELPIDGAEGLSQSAGVHVNSTEEDWDNDDAVDIAAYQGLVDRLHDKAEKEFQRVVKVSGSSILDLITDY